MSHADSIAGKVGTVAKFITDPSGAMQYIGDKLKGGEHQLETAFDDTAKAGFGDGTLSQQKHILDANYLDPNEVVLQTSPYGPPQIGNAGVFSKTA